MLFSNRFVNWDAEEDRVLARLAKNREQTLDQKKAPTHDQTWGSLKRSKL